MAPIPRALPLSLEMRIFRPAGIDGSSHSVSFSPAAFRRQTIMEPRGTKQPAEEQPPGQPRVKAVRGLDDRKEKMEAGNPSQ